MKVGFYAPLKAPTHPVPSGDRTIAAGLWEEFVRHGHECLLLSEFRSAGFYRSPGGWLRAGTALAAAARRARAFGPDVFFTYHLYYKAPDPIGALLGRLHGRPYVVYEASHAEHPRRRWNTAAGYHLTRRAIAGAAHAFSDVADDLPELRALLPAERVSFVPPSVDGAVFRPDAESRARWRRRHGIAEDEVVVACVAMLRADRKADGVAFLIESLGELARRGLKARLVLAGGGECSARIEGLARSVLGSSALLLGCVAREEAAELLRAADLFAFPGIDEAFGLVYLEAQACGLPVAAFRNGGVPEAVADGETGLLTPPLDRAAYASALARLIGDADLRHRLGAAARARMLARHQPGVNYGAVVERCEALAREAGLAREETR